MRFDVFWPQSQSRVPCSGPFFDHALVATEDTAVFFPNAVCFATRPCQDASSIATPTAVLTYLGE